VIGGKTVESTESEKALIAQINFEPSRATHDGETARVNGEAVHSERAWGPIPRVRPKLHADSHGGGGRRAGAGRRGRGGPCPP